MTFCLGIKVQEGLVGIADTRVTTGSECITAKKVNVYQGENWSMFLMTSGLRSVRDKALTYFDEIMEDQPSHGRLFKAANLLSEQIRRVAREDKASLEASGFKFNFHALVGGQFEKDREHKLYLLYPEGNWVEIGCGTPYHIIGASGYGKPVLDRTLKYEDAMRFALKVGCLAFDSTRISAADVDFPIDIVLYSRDSGRTHERRYEKSDLIDMSNRWEERLRKSVRELHMDWLEELFATLPTTALMPLPATALMPLRSAEPDASGGQK
jgi:putative proteasome-type protease